MKKKKTKNKVKREPWKRGNICGCGCGLPLKKLDAYGYKG